ncbi:MAG: FtsX-like permease family protein [Planctomycetota bacterium]|nr:FtsX-like permease family protein [Planctomycetaceae bacterium]MDQ3329111.1 FtsX-like permease family protein [Planctomycetota bacterium]
MTTFRLLLNSLAFYWRTHLAVLLGVAAGAAVIGGALIVGDSVRESLRQMTLKRLGRVDYAISGAKFFTEGLASRLQKPLSAQAGDTNVAPALSMRGGLTHQVDDTINRAGGVSVFGVDERLWAMLDHGEIAPPASGEVILNRRVADALAVKVGDDVSLNIEVPSAIPRESLLGERNDLTRELPLRVATVLEDDLGAARFGLSPGQQIPPVAFTSLGDLQSTLGLAAVRPSRRNSTAKPARVNSLFVASAGDAVVEDAASHASRLTETLHAELSIEDLVLRVVPVGERGYVSLESTRMILDDETVDAAGSAAESLANGEEIATSPVYVYLVNEFANAGDRQRHAMYSVVAGIDFQRSAQPPFGPFEYLSGGPPTKPDEIVLNEFLADEQLNVAVGDEVVVKYYEVGSHGELPEEERRFRVAGIVKLDDVASDRSLTPMLEGITDADTFSDWEQPFEMDLSRITGADEDYWDQYRATPKAFLPLSVMRELFPSRYGTLTSIRVAVPEGETADDFAARFRNSVIAAVDLQELGLAFQPVKLQGLQASSGTTDFTQLFVAFSFFLILSAAILIGLLFRLGVERRATSIGLVQAIGFTPAKVRRLYLAEGAIVVLAGAALGTVAAVAYAALMIHGLTTWWIGAIGTRFLYLSASPMSLAIGFCSAVVIAMVAVWWGLRRLSKVTSRALLAGATEPEQTLKGQQRRGRLAAWLAITAGAVALLLVAGGLLDLIPGDEAFGGFSWQVVAFFIAGTLLLTAALAGLSAWLGRDRADALHSAVGLGVRNAERQRLRSVSTVGLIASATFVLVAVAASQRDPSAELPQKDSGNGGFLLVAQSTTPLPFAIDTSAGREKLGVNVAGKSSDEQLLDQMHAVSFRVRQGDDASCLNLYQTGLPTVLGAPHAMIERGGFKFTSTPGDRPWSLLEQKADDVQSVPTYPVFGDANTLMYSLKKGVGDLIYVPNEENPRYALRVAGMLDGSVFQGVLMMSEASFIELYPDIDGYGYFLIEGPVGQRDELSNVLETQLTPYGFDAEPVADRIADFLAVQNTYLSTFQALGGLGLLLGTFGLGTVMLRNVLERRAELALLRAVGFKNAKLALLVLIENALLLLWGLAAGTAAALLAVSPHLASRGADVPIGPGTAMLGGVAVVGMLASLFAVRAAVQTPIVATLRGE